MFKRLQSGGNSLWAGMASCASLLTLWWQHSAQMSGIFTCPLRVCISHFVEVQNVPSFPGHPNSHFLCAPVISQILGAVEATWTYPPLSQAIGSPFYPENNYALQDTETPTGLLLAVHRADLRAKLCVGGGSAFRVQAPAPWRGNSSSVQVTLALGHPREIQACGAV